MASLQIEIPEPLHRALKLEAVRQGVTLKTLATTILADRVEVEDEAPPAPSGHRIGKS